MIFETGKENVMKTYQKLLCAVCLMMFVCTGYAAEKAKTTAPKKPADQTATAEKAPVKATAETGKPWQETFKVDKANLVSAGKNPFFILEPGYRLHYKDGQDTLIISVTNEIKLIDGVKTRIVEERETAKGKLAEVSRNYYAIDKTNNAVYYFGEDVDMYKDGVVTGHEGSWKSGEKGAKFGLMMPAQPKAGDRYHQEVAPGIAMDRAEIISTTEKVTVPAGTYENCLTTKDGSTIETGVGTKQYAPGVGLIRDDSFVLEKIELPAMKAPKAPKADAAKKEMPKKEIQPKQPLPTAK
jgi:hypothetical protein